MMSTLRLRARLLTRLTRLLTTPDPVTPEPAPVPEVETLPTPLPPRPSLAVRRSLREFQAERLLEPDERRSEGNTSLRVAYVETRLNIMLAEKAIAGSPGSDAPARLCRMDAERRLVGLRARLDRMHGRITVRTAEALDEAIPGYWNQLEAGAKDILVGGTRSPA